MSRKIVIAGNWKMHKTNAEAMQLAKQIRMKTTDIKKTGMIVCPPFTALSVVNEILKDSSVCLGAQNIFWEKEGAYTGEISAGMIKSSGANYVILGHSERRQYFGETDETVNKKVKTALDNGLKPIVCVGESLEQREQNITKRVITRQVKGAFDGLTPEMMAHVIVAYEPIWAIGTGKTATPGDAEVMAEAIRSALAGRYGEAFAGEVRVLYGGSIKPANFAQILAGPNVDGGLVGGASLEVASFAELVRLAAGL